MSFLEGRMNDEKVFGDVVVFPKTLLPSHPSTANLAEMVRGERDWLVKMLDQHAALLFRGFSVDSPEAFDDVIQAFGWEHCNYYGSGGNRRIRFSDRVYGVNGVPPQQFINFHHEMARVKESPSKIFFFCCEPAPEGGETSIVLSNIVVNRMEEKYPEIMAKISELGMIFSIKTASYDGSGSGFDSDKPWRSYWNTADEEEARKRFDNCKRIVSLLTNMLIYVYPSIHVSDGFSNLSVLKFIRVQESSFYPNVSVNFFEDGSAEMTYGPLNPIREFGEKRAWFIPILGYKDKIQGVSNRFGDGSEFPSEALDNFRDILEGNCVDVKWQKGDVLLLDNFAVQHARRPGKPPRVMLMSACK